jgi:hypothetical protein
MRLRPLALLASLVFLVGAGCDPTATIGFRSPFEFGNQTSQAAAYQLETAPGMRLVVRPSAFGTGILNELIGQDAGVKDVTVKEFTSDRVVLGWQERTDSATATPRTGTVEATKLENAHNAVPPGLWKPGSSAVESEGLLWLSSGAYAELTATGATEWGVTSLDGGALSTAQKTLQNIEHTVERFLPSATSTSPFVVRKLNDVPAYPLRVNGKMESVEAVRVAGFLAEYIVLKNPDAPLILKMTAQPAAYGALAALKPLGLDPDAFGYEVSEVKTK